MQIAIFSDIHANLQAWNAVLIDSRSLNVDSMLCLGDIVGYGPNPAEVLTSVHANVPHIVLGNHDAAVCGKLSPELFHDRAAELVNWTRSNLNNKAVNFLRNLPLAIECEHFRCAHGDISDPASFFYISEAEDAAPSWDAHDNNLFLVGHTHEPAIFVLGNSGIPRVVEPQDFMIEDSKRYIVNPGSVGQPRDGLALASYCIYDTETRALYWRRVPFDLDQYIDSVRQHGLDESVNGFLQDDPRKSTIAARELTDFSPARYEADKATEVIEVKQLNQFEVKARRWRKSFTTILALLILLIVATASIGYRNITKKQMIPALSAFNEGAPIDISLMLKENPNLPLSRFDVIIGNKRRQHLEVIKVSKGSIIKAASYSDEPICIETPFMTAKPGAKLLLQALIREHDGFQGNASAFISLKKGGQRNSETIPRYLVKAPNLPRQDRYILAKKTFTVPADTSHIALGLELNFQGEIDIAELSLTEKE